MPFLPGLAVVFIGITGSGGSGSTGRVEKQVQSLLHDRHVDAKSIPAATLRTLAHHGEGSRELVQALHVSGAVGGELITSDGHLTLRLVIYNGDGGLRSLSELPLNGKVLSAEELGMLRSNLDDDVTALVGAARSVEPVDDDAPSPPPTPKAHPVVAAKPVVKAPVAPSGELEFSPEAARRDDAPPAHAAAAPQVADSESTDLGGDAGDTVRPEELEAMTQAVAGVSEVATPGSADGDLHMGATIGLGVAGRSFAGPATLPAYASAAVGTVSLAAHIQPTPRITLGALLDHTVAMTTPMSDNTSAPTTMSRWEVGATYALHRGAVDVSPELGLGSRSFSIESTDPSRSPDGDYSYVIIGARATSDLGKHVTLRGNFAFEPVVSGTQPTAALFGPASRWAIDLGAALEVRPWRHLFARAAVDYQRFAWSWDMAGARGAGGAVDGYPSGTLALGADY